MTDHAEALAEFDAGIWSARSQADLAAATARFVQHFNPTPQRKESKMSASEQTVTVDKAAWEQLQRDAAAAPEFIRRAKAAQANPVRAAAQPSRFSAPATPPCEPSEDDWQDFMWSTGMPGYRRPQRPLGEVYLGGARSETSTAADADYDAFVSTLNLGRPR